MNVSTVFISTYRYDQDLLRTCIASVRYWYPSIPVVLIKDTGQGGFDTSRVEDVFAAQVFPVNRRLGWGYGKLEPLFRRERSAFLMLDADTVMAGPVLNKVREIDADFIVDREVQPEERFNEIYYNLTKIAEVRPGFRYPGYSFNSGQWFGTSGILDRSDFNDTLEWTEPPRPKYPDIVFNGDQAHLNFLLHWKEQTAQVTVERIPLMIWPQNGAADFIDLDAIRGRSSDYPYIVHWAGMKDVSLRQLPRGDILRFFEDVYYDATGQRQRVKDRIEDRRRFMERQWKTFGRKVKAKLFGR